jgi:16S rRNA (guanine527-N7)-methyltransferase
MPRQELAPLLDAALQKLSLAADSMQKEQLLHFVALVLEGLQTQRLVGDRNASDLIGKHIFDSLFPLTVLDLAPGELLDLGTGAGLPGIPLKIWLPRCPLFLMDANRRKLNFLRRATAMMKLREVYFLPGRAETWGRNHLYRERFAYVTCRAVAGAAVLAELALPLLQTGGELIMYKGAQGLCEVEQAGDAITACGGQVRKSWAYRLPSGEGRTLFLIEKIKATPDDYPRPPGKPAQKPLGHKTFSF